MRFLLPLFAVLPLAAQAQDPLSLTDFGRTVFYSTALSVTQTQSCSSCHAAEAGFAAPAEGARSLGGVVEGAVAGRFGNRKPPSVAYAGYAPVLHHIFEDGAPLLIGGLFFDGRATGGASGDPLRDQAAGPILNPAEMALPDAACVAVRLCDQGLAALVAPEICAPAALEPLRAPCSDPDASFLLTDLQAEQAATALDTVAAALAAFERSAEVNRFSSRFDRGELSPSEARGKDLFDIKAKCAACHIDTAAPGGVPALFTDFTYDNLGIPPNPAAPPLIDHQVAGVATTLALDPIYAALAPEYAGKHQVPTLRNLTAGGARSYMHNGYFQTLTGVVQFYNTHDVWPSCPDLLTETQALAAKCWPRAEVPGTVNHEELGNLKLTDAEIVDIVAFLHTLDDE